MVLGLVGCGVWEIVGLGVVWKWVGCLGFLYFVEGCDLWWMMVKLICMMEGGCMEKSLMVWWISKMMLGEDLVVEMVWIWLVVRYVIVSW